MGPCEIRTQRTLVLLVVLACVALGACAGTTRTAPITVEELPGLCTPIAAAPAGSWATSCLGGSVSNVDTGTAIDLRCPNQVDALVDAIVAVPGDVVAIFGCVDVNSPRTMAQSLVKNPGSPPVDMGFPAYALGPAVYVPGDGGSIVMLSGKCDGLLAYRFTSLESLAGRMVPISSISIDGRTLELDANRDYEAAPPCTKLSAVSGLGASDDGSVLALAVEGPASASIFERPVDTYVGTVSIRDSSKGFVLDGDMRRIAADRPHPAYQIGVVICGGEPKLVIGEKGRLKLLSKGQVTLLSLPTDSEWSGKAVSSDGRSLLAATEIPFAAGVLYRANDVHLC